MADHLTTGGRSRVMASIHAVNTKPELAIRRELRLAGATGYRLHLRSLPGRPDVAFTRWRVAVFVDGVFWHGHPDHFNPVTASDYWRAKIARTQERDGKADAALASRGWAVVHIWDLEVKKDAPVAAGRILECLRAAGWSERRTADA